MKYIEFKVITNIRENVHNSYSYEYSISARWKIWRMVKNQVYFNVKHHVRDEISDVRLFLFL